MIIDNSGHYFYQGTCAQSLMIEINRWLYLGEDYSVDSERAKTLVNVLRRVVEVLENN